MSIESFVEFGKAAEKVATALGDLAQALDVVSQIPCFTTPPWKENPSVMISINPKWCELIASGSKTIEVRKTKPKIEMPFKCYIYQTMKPNQFGDIAPTSGKVIGEFICDKITIGIPTYKDYDVGYWDILEGSCLTLDELFDYGKWKTLYGWHISDLVIYDKPKELREFKKTCKETNLCYPDNCNRCGWNILLRPPQSWFYIEVLEDT
ncbi:MAG: hypothetical protein U0M06_02885 [Clostridia bacterium]|nr:hypothetical protein [Clostridia bacterium]